MDENLTIRELSHLYTKKGRLLPLERQSCKMRLREAMSPVCKDSLLWFLNHALSRSN